MKALVLGVFLAGFATCAQAGDELAILPANPGPGQGITAQVTRTLACAWLPNMIAPVIQGTTIKLTLSTSDVCEYDVPDHQRSYPLGPLQPGEYTIVLQACGYDILHGYRCATIDSIPLAIAGAAATAVPVFDVRGALVLASVMLIGAIARLR